MKNVKLLIVGVFFLFLSFGVMAQAPDPPGGAHGGGGDEAPGGGGAPIGGGTVMLLILGAAYGGKKVFNLVSKSKETLEE